MIEKKNIIFTNFLEEIKKEDRYRKFRKIIRNKDTWPLIQYFSHKSNSIKDVYAWCGTDYLGMSRNKIVCKDAINAIEKFGVGSGGTRNIAGNYHIINDLEELIASIHKKEAALVFSSGYLSNFASIASIGKITNKEMIIFSDELNHASIIDGIRYSGCKKFIFKHNDINHLRSLLELVPVNSQKIIIFESIYSMNGSIGKIKEICDLAYEFSAMTFIDEVHAVGVYGSNGGGISNILNLENKLDIIQGSFSKGYGVNGGYITGSKDVIDAIRSAASGFIFSSTMPISVAASCLSSVKYLSKSNEERYRYFKNLDYILKQFKKYNIQTISKNSHIMSIPINNAKKVKEISDFLIEERGIYIQHINYPTVPKGTERLRITITPEHNEELIDKFALSLKEVLDMFDIKFNSDIIIDNNIIRDYA